MTVGAGASPRSTRRRPRDRILDAAPEVLREAGFARFGLVEVARAAQVSRQTIYNHFSSRDELLAELFVLEMRATHVPQLRAIGLEPPSPKHLADYFLAELRVGRTFPLFPDLLTPATAPRVAELIFESAAVGAMREELWGPVLRRYEAAGLLRDGLDVSEAIRWITYQQYWLVTHPGLLCADTEEAIEQIVSTFVVPAVLRHDVL